MRLVTIGGYGFDEPGFLAALQRANVDTFVDVRQRRGLRGSQYAFLNSSRLQRALTGVGIRYIHLRELAPTQAVRDVQKRRDSETDTGKRSRQSLSPEFVHAYRTEVLDGFDVSAFHRAVGDDAQVVALFCVEGIPEACHRSLVAERLAQTSAVEVEHIRP
jgi:uncharacterized protein (DUF488 family)